jgi:hypothetical protein
MSKLPMNAREELKHRVGKWLFSEKWTDTHTEYDEIEALSELVETEARLEYRLQLETLLYEAIVELEGVQCVENCNSGLCATGKGKWLIEKGMAVLGVDDLSEETWKDVLRKEGKL